MDLDKMFASFRASSAALEPYYYWDEPFHRRLYWEFNSIKLVDGFIPPYKGQFPLACCLILLRKKGYIKHWLWYPFPSLFRIIEILRIAEQEQAVQIQWFETNPLPGKRNLPADPIFSKASR